MFCQKCGAELPEGAVFCSRCGAEQVRMNQTKLLDADEREENGRSVGIDKIYFDISLEDRGKEFKRDKTTVFVKAGLVMVFAAAVVVLISSVLGQRNAKKVVESAVHKTIQVLQEEAEEGIAEGKEFGYFLEVAGKYHADSFSDAETAELLSELEDFRILFSGKVTDGNQGICGSMEVGMGDMKNIRFHYEMGEEGFYLFLPNLYQRTFLIPQEFLEDTMGTDLEGDDNREAGKEALLSFGKTLSNLYQELYEKAACKKIGKESLTEYGNRKTICYEVTVSAEEYQVYLENLPERLKEDTILIDWLTEISSKWEVEKFFTLLEEEIERYQIPKNVDYIILGNVYVDKKGQMVRLEIPFRTEEKLVISFLGEERLSDYISVQMQMEEDSFSQKLTFLYQPWDETQQQSIGIEKENPLIFAEWNQEELGEAIIEILNNISKGGYLPSQYREILDELLLYLTMDTEEYPSYNEYENWEQELEYSEAGNPILTDFWESYQIELTAPPDSKLDSDWSYSEMVCFTDIEEEQDYYYSIEQREDDTTDRFLAEREYITTENGYRNIVFSDIIQKEINGYQVYYQYCSYDNMTMPGFKTYYAWVRLDKDYVFELYLDDYTNSVEDSILDGCFQAVLPIK